MYRSVAPVSIWRRLSAPFTDTLPPDEQTAKVNFITADQITLDEIERIVILSRSQSVSHCRCTERTRERPSGCLSRSGGAGFRRGAMRFPLVVCPVRGFFLNTRNLLRRRAKAHALPWAELRTASQRVPWRVLCCEEQWVPYGSHRPCGSGSTRPAAGRRGYRASSPAADCVRRASILPMLKLPRKSRISVEPSDSHPTRPVCMGCGPTAEEVEGGKS